MERVGIIGTGNMGESILKALLKNSVEKNNLCFIEAKKERALYIADTYGIDEAREMTELAKRSDIMVLAVKPQDAAKILPRDRLFYDGFPHPDIHNGGHNDIQGSFPSRAHR